MFMPVEPAYIEVMRSQRELFNHGYQKNVVLVSHTTLMPILRTVANLWMIEHSNREAREISERAGDIYNTVCLLGERLYALGASISTTANKYNDAVKAVQGKQGLVGKVDRFQSLSKRANKSFPEALSPIDPEIDTRVSRNFRTQSNRSRPRATTLHGGNDRLNHPQISRLATARAFCSINSRRGSTSSPISVENI